MVLMETAYIFSLCFGTKVLAIASLPGLSTIQKFLKKTSTKIQEAQEYTGTKRFLGSEYN